MWEHDDFKKNEVLKLIEEEYNSFLSIMYAGKKLPDRRELDQFFTPPEITIEMLAKFNCTEEEFKHTDILDPTCGSGNLLVACILAGADPKRIYGNEYDADMVDACRKRLKKYGVIRYHIHQGNALQKKCLNDFSYDYIRTEGDKRYNPDYIGDLEYAQNDLFSWEQENDAARERKNKKDGTAGEYKDPKAEKEKAKSQTLEPTECW